MFRYRDLWVITATATTTLGIWAALMTWPLLELLIAFTFVAVSAAGMHAAIQVTDAPLRLGKSLAVGAGIATGVIGAVGLALLIHGAALLVLLAAVASHPAAVSWLQRHLQGVRHTPGASQPSQTKPAEHRQPPEPASPLAVADVELPVDVSLDDAALCRAWRQSYRALHRASSLLELVHIVNARRDYLDELERRNPSGLEAWLASGPHPASDPSRYIRQPHRSEPPSAT